MIVVVVIDIIFVVCLLVLHNAARKEKKILKTWRPTDALIVKREINQRNFGEGRNVYRVKVDLLYLDDQFNTVEFDVAVFGPLSYENMIVGELLEIR